jgi:hypothetical protein
MNQGEMSCSMQKERRSLADQSGTSFDMQQTPSNTDDAGLEKRPDPFG